MAKFLSIKVRKLYFRLVYFLIICAIFLILFYVLQALLNFIIQQNQVCPKNDPIDVVYTWVNGSDPVFLKDLNDFLKSHNITDEENYLSQRFDDKYELQFSLRSLEKYAPWINHVYIVTNGQIPYWLNLDYEKVTLVTHKEIFFNQMNLPTFSSPAIESQLHRIPGISKKFLYFNDDIFLGQPIYIDDFISPNKGYLLYLSYSIGKCAPNCFWVYVADDQCDDSCNNFDCQYDGGDCDKPQFPLKLNNNDTGFDVNWKELSFKSVNNRRIKAKEENDKKKDENNYPHFKIATQYRSANNYSELVQKHNNEIMMNEKIKRKRLERRQKKLRTLKLNRHNSTDAKFLNTKRCAYDASLQYSNRLFNSKYGFIPRAVPSHTPVLINKDIVEDLQKKFFKEVLITSENKLRSYNDLQFSFTYYYFIIHEKEDSTVADIFDMFDVDNSKTWSDREIRTLLTRIYQIPLSYAAIEHFESLLSNCSHKKVYKNVGTVEFERYLDSSLPTIYKQLVIDCPELREILTTHFGTNKKYKYEIVKNFGNQYIYFKQLTSNVSDVVGHLDEIRSEPRKFVCLNDNMDHNRHSENKLINTIIYDFYMSFFPFPSQFELPKEYRNRFLHVEQLIEWKSRHTKIKLFIYLLMLFVFYFVCFNMCIKKICVVINRLFY